MRGDNLGDMDPKLLEKVAAVIAASVKGVTIDKARKIIELKLGDPPIGYRAIGKSVNLKKDKVMEVWKTAEPMLDLLKETSEVPEKPRDEGELYSEGFTEIEKLSKKGLKPGDIATQLVKKFKVIPKKAREMVREYFDLEDLNIIALEGKIEEMDADLGELRGTIELSLHHGRDKQKKCGHFNESDGTCRLWRWSSRPDDPWIRDDMVRIGDKWHLAVSEHPEFCATCASYRPRSQGWGL